MVVATDRRNFAIRKVRDMSQLAPTHESSLLLTLEEISQLVSHSHHPGETLTNIVRLIQGRFRTDVCSVYLLEPDQGELVLGATVGLKPESVGQVRMRLDEGLTGLVAEKMSPVMVVDAFAHPRFKYFPEAGEDPYHSFLGVPLVEGGTIQGVLVVQTLEARTFSANEMRMLVTVAAQLAPLVSEARLIEQVVAAAHRPEEAPDRQEAAEPVTVQGTPLSPGIGVGQAYLVNGFRDRRRTEERRQVDLATEQGRLALALKEARDEINRLSQRISTLVGEDHGAILQGQLMIMQDSTIEQDLTGCLAAGCTAEDALLQTLDKYALAFQKLTNPLFQERVYDIKDVFRRVLWHLRPRPPTGDPGADKLILVSHEASVMDLFSVDLDRLAGVIVEHGGPQSHAAILARSLNIPMVGQVPELLGRLQPGRRLKVDGSAGLVCLDPGSQCLGVRDASPPAGTAQPLPAPISAAELQGFPKIEANINLLCELREAVERGASGVGLYRSEFLFLARRTLPTEEEQVGIYRKLLQAMQGRPVSIRTFDLRPDKLAHYAHLSSASSHPLDWRLVLDSPPLQKLFKDQVRAILRAATEGPARILVPMVMRTEQLDFVIDTVTTAREELQREGLEFGSDVPLGIMLEAAAATTMVGAWADQVDYFALGTNDLVASALALDREDPVGADRDDPLHPGVLRLVQSVVSAAHRAQRCVSVCGEMASDPQGTLALAALEVDSVSVAVHQLDSVRRTLAAQTPTGLLALAPEVLSSRKAVHVRELLQRHTPSEPEA
jgi:phosphotransferase system enzyme I (PtsP)